MGSYVNKLCHDQRIPNTYLYIGDYCCSTCQHGRLASSTWWDGGFTGSTCRDGRNDTCCCWRESRCSWQSGLMSPNGTLGQCGANANTTCQDSGGDTHLGRECCCWTWRWDWHADWTWQLQGPEGMTCPSRALSKSSGASTKLYVAHQRLLLELFQLLPLFLQNDNVEAKLLPRFEHKSFQVPSVTFVETLLIEVQFIILSQKVYPFLVLHNELGLAPRKLWTKQLDEWHQCGQGNGCKVRCCAVSINIL